MKAKLIHRLLIIAAVVSFSCLHSYALEVSVQPGEVKPGDAFLVTLISDAQSPAEVVFQDRTIDFYPAEEGLLIALVPVDITTPPDHYTVITAQGEKKVSASVTVASHTFKTINLTLPEGKVTLSPEDQKRATNEALLLKKIWPESSVKAWNGEFVPPTDTEISEVFGVNRIMNKKKNSVHRGMDFRGKTGTPVKAINSGTVVLTDNLFYGGNTLIVDHGMGLYSVYMHLSELKAEKGDEVSKNQIIGLIGSSGRVTGPHLHMSVKLNGVSVNPESLFRLEL